MKPKDKFRYGRLTAAACIVLTAVIAALCIAGVNAKYAKKYTFDGSLYIESVLSSDILLYEHKAYRQADGGYLLAKEAAAVYENEYTVLPGVNIPKDPCIYVKSLNNETVYIFIEVCDSLSSDTVSWSMDDCWLKLDGVKGANGGDVYVYSTDKSTPALVDGNSTAQTYSETEQTTSVENTTAAVSYSLVINIVKNQTVTVGSNYVGTDTGSLVFYGYVAHADSGDDAADVFNTFFAEINP